MVIDEIHKVLQAQAPLEHAGSVVLRIPIKLTPSFRFELTP